MTHRFRFAGGLMLASTTFLHSCYLADQFTGIKHLRSPTIQYLTFEKAQPPFAMFDLRVQIHNPRSYSFELKSMEYEVWHKSNLLATEHIVNNIEIRFGMANIVSIPLRPNFKKIPKDLTNLLLGRNSLPITIKGNYTTKSMWGIANHPFQLSTLLSNRRIVR